MKPRRVLHAESSLGIGGQEFRIVLEAKEMARRGHTVVLAANPHNKVREYAERNGVCVEPITMWKWRVDPVESIGGEMIRDRGADAKRVACIPTGVDLERFRTRPGDKALKRGFGFDASAPVVGTVAFLRKEKGIQHFSEAASLVLQNVPAARFMITPRRRHASIRDTGAGDGASRRRHEGGCDS